LLTDRHNGVRTACQDQKFRLRRFAVPFQPQPRVQIPDTSPRWDGFRRIVLGLGLPMATVALVALVWVISLAITYLVIRLAGQGSLGLGFAIATACVLLSGPVVGYGVLRLIFQLEASRQRIAELAVTDELTGCYNRRHFMERAELEWLRSRRHHMPLALILLDADDFKLVNDTHGHQCGDHLLREMALQCRASLRGTDVLARFGGEELIALLPQTDLAGALAMAERIRHQVQDLVVQWQGQAVMATVSLGVAALHAGHASVDTLIRDADQALYEAKRAGRNRVHGAPVQDVLPELAIVEPAVQA
jgi:diguanylate cyclase (GGDEF)-like protein